MTDSADTGLPPAVVAPWGQQPTIPPAPPVPPAIEQVAETQTEQAPAEGISSAGADLSSLAPPAPPIVETPPAPPAPAVEPTPAPIPPAPPVHVIDVPKVFEQAEDVDEDSEMITVTVPKSYTLRMDTHVQRKVPVGIQEMRRDEAEHWYSKANGVRIYRP